LIALAWLLKGKRKLEPREETIRRRSCGENKGNSKNVVNKVCCAWIDLVGFFFILLPSFGGWRRFFGVTWLAPKKKRLSAEMAKQRK